MAVRSGIGFTVAGPNDASGLFGEAPSRVLVCVPPDQLDALQARAARSGVPITVLGRAGGDRVIVDGLVDLSLSDTIDRWRGALPRALAVADTAVSV
jgi:hypothetical protein